MRLKNCFRDLDRFLTRQMVERGERFNAAHAALTRPEFRRLLKRLGVPLDATLQAMLLARDPDARTFAEYGRHRALLLMDLPSEYRVPFLRAHDVAGMDLVDLYSAIRLFARLDHAIALTPGANGTAAPTLCVVTKKEVNQ